MTQGSTSEQDFVLGLEENARDSLVHGVEHFLASEGNTRPTNLKYTILHIFHAVELFLKARLAKAHPILIYSKPETAGDNSHTVDFNTLTGRLNKVGVSLSQQDLGDLTALRMARNSIEHHRIACNREEIENYIGQAMRFLEGFLQEELNISLHSTLDAETYHALSQALYTYKERLERAQQAMDRSLNQVAVRLKDRLEYDTLSCPLCEQLAVKFPDPTTQDGTVHCFFCQAILYAETCCRCGSVQLSTEPFDQENSPSLQPCDDCWDQMMGED